MTTLPHPRAPRPPGPGAFLLTAVWTAALAVGPAAASEPPGTASPFRFRSIDDRSLGLWDGDRPVLVYNHGPHTKAGSQANRPRSTYIHPIYGLDGEVLTDDFPADHPHHRGLFWAWPHVTIDGRQYDMWVLNGIEPRFVKWTRQDTGPDTATLGVENGWFVGERKVMREQLQIIAHRPDDLGRAIDLDFTWTPQERPITLLGAEGKSYGGMTLRFAPGEPTTITVPTGRSKDDLLMTPLPWADLSRDWPGDRGTSGAALFVHPSHPGFPPTWLTRHYGAICVGWPGVHSRTLAAGEPIRCRYRVWVHRGTPGVPPIERAYAKFAATP